MRIYIFCNIYPQLSCVFILSRMCGRGEGSSGRVFRLKEKERHGREKQQNQPRNSPRRASKAIAKTGIKLFSHYVGTYLCFHEYEMELSFIFESERRLWLSCNVKSMVLSNRFKYKDKMAALLKISTRYCISTYFHFLIFFYFLLIKEYKNNKSTTSL